MLTPFEQNEMNISTNEQTSWGRASAASLEHLAQLRSGEHTGILGSPHAVVRAQRLLYPVPAGSSHKGPLQQPGIAVGHGPSFLPAAAAILRQGVE